MSRSKQSCQSLPWDQSLRLVGDPVDVVTGVQAFNETDFRLEGAHIPIKWVRRSDSRHHRIDRGVGYGFRLFFDVELRFDLDGITFVNGASEAIEFPFLKQDDERIVRGAHQLTRQSRHHYLVSPPGGAATWGFHFDRDGTARASALLDPDNRHPPVRLSYEKGFLAAMHVEAGRRVVFEYTGRHLATAVLLEAGNPAKQRLVRYQYDEQDQLIAIEDAYGSTVRYEYEKDHRLTRLTDRRGYSFLFSYDGDGRCIHSRAEDGVEDYRFDYKPLEQLTVVTRGDGAVTRYYYDEQNSLVEVVDACGGMTAYLKDASGRVVAEVDPNGNESQILYDSRGSAYAQRDPLGYVRRMPVDPSLHPLAHRLPKSPVQWEHGAWAGPVQPVPEDVPLAKWLPRWLLDAWGEAPTYPGVRSTLVKNVQGLPVREERRGKTSRWAYDNNGNLRWFTDFDGKTSRYEYTSWNHLHCEIDPLGSITEYGYTKSEQLASIVDPLGTRHDYGYDLKDRLTLVRRHGKVREQYRYDGADNLIAKLDGSGQPILTFAFGPGNLMSRRQLASGDVQGFEYTEAGRLATAKNRAGLATFSYGAAGCRKTDERDGKGVRHGFSGTGLTHTTVLGTFTTQYLRPDPQTVVVVDPAGQTQRIRLAGPGLIERSCSNDVEELSHYDVAGRCLFKAAAGGRLRSAWVRRFEYSGEGDLVRRGDTLRSSVTFEHDDAHRLSKVRFQNGTTQDYVYDRAGNLLRAPGLVARVQAGNRLLEANDDSFTYNDRDHIAVRHSCSGDTTYAYDARDLLVGIEGPGLSYKAEHDALGRRTKKTVNARVWQYYWDTDRLAAEVFPSGSLRVYVYPDAVSWVPMLFLDYDSVDTAPTSGKRYHVYTDHLGCPELILDDAGHTAWRARIDPYGVAHVDVGGDFHQPLRWPGHYFDAETGLHDNRFRTYSPELGRYLQSDPAGTEGALNLYVYTSNPLRTVDLRGMNDNCPECQAKEAQQAKEAGADAEGTKKPGKDAPEGEGGEPPGGLPKAKPCDEAARECGMDPDDASRLSNRSQDRGQLAIIRGSNPESQKYRHDPEVVAKPVTEKRHTAPAGSPNAGLVVDDQGQPVTTTDGRRIHGDYDMQGVYDKQPDGSYKRVDTNDPQMVKDMNKEVTPDKPMFQHGANDDFTKTDAEGNTVMGRQPGPDEKYLIAEPDGTTRVADNTAQLKNYYDQQGIPWPYN